MIRASYPLEPTSHFLARQLLITNHENCDHANCWGESELDPGGGGLLDLRKKYAVFLLYIVKQLGNLGNLYLTAIINGPLETDM